MAPVDVMTPSATACTTPKAADSVRMRRVVTPAAPTPPPPPQRRTRRFCSATVKTHPAVLMVIGALGLVVASAGWWLERSFLNTAHFTETANQLLDQSAIQTELTAVLVRQISHAAGTDLRLAEPFLASIVSQVVES